MQSQPILTPKAVVQSAKQQPKDLTATLLKNNLDELNLSMSRSNMSQQPDYAAKNNMSFSWNKNNNINQAQFLTTSPMINSQMMSNQPMNWNSNGMNTSINWNSSQPMSTWNSITPQNNMNFSAQSDVRPNFPGTLQPFMSNTQSSANNTNSSTQDIMDLLS